MLTDFNETAARDDAVIHGYLENAGKKYASELTLKEGLALVAELRAIKVPIIMECGKVLTVSKETYDHLIRHRFSDCTSCLEKGDQAQCPTEKYIKEWEEELD